MECWLPSSSGLVSRSQFGQGQCPAASGSQRPWGSGRTVEPLAEGPCTPKPPPPASSRAAGVPMGLLWGLARPRPATQQSRKKLQKAGPRSLTNRPRSSLSPDQIPAAHHLEHPAAPPSDALRDRLQPPTPSQHVCDTVTNRCGRHCGRCRSHGRCCWYASSLPLAPTHAPADAPAGVPDHVAQALTFALPPTSTLSMSRVTDIRPAQHMPPTSTTAAATAPSSGSNCAGASASKHAPKRTRPTPVPPPRGRPLRMPSTAPRRRASPPALRRRRPTSWSRSRLARC